MNAVLLANLGVAALLGGAFGSFLTVVASRVPALINADPDGRPSFNASLSAISWPSSHCTACKTPLSWYENVPVLAYLLLKGKCRHCHQGFGATSLVLELGSVAAAAGCVLAYGWNLQAALCFVLLATLLALITIDLKEMLLPDILVLPLLPLGLWFQHVYGDGLQSALLGAATGFGLLWTIGAGYRMARGVDGLGGGDVKLAGALGAWLGLVQMPLFLMGAFLSGTLVMGFALVAGRGQADRPLPFGPFLAISAAVCLLFPGLTPAFLRLLAG